MNVLIIVSFLCWIAGFFINGFTLYSVLLIIPTVMFALRKFAIHIGLANIVTAEVLLLFFSVVWKLIFHKFALLKFILTLVVRLIFIILVIYDDTVFVYVSEERKRK